MISVYQAFLWSLVFLALEFLSFSLGGTFKLLDANCRWTQVALHMSQSS